MSHKLVVNKIYPAFMGEVNKYGIGAKCTFLRLAGCNIRCYKDTMGHYCDTPEALKGVDGVKMSNTEIINELLEIGCDLICLTGGEPLMYKPIELIKEMSEKGFKVVIETNGTMEIEEYRGIEGVSFVIDYKLPSTGEYKTFQNSIIPLMRKDDYLKFVINDWEDYKVMLVLYDTLKMGSYPVLNFAVGLFWGSKITYQELMAQLIKNNLEVELNMQIHKMAVLYDKYKDEANDLYIPRDL